MHVHEFVFRAVDGSNMPLSRWQGQPLLLVNTASECGFTPQYEQLQQLWQEYRPAGLVVIGVPCNEFGEQEPGEDSEIQSFCESRYGVNFPITSRQIIIGRGAHPLFRELREQYTSEILPRWNFYKYLFGRDGELIKHWPSDVSPADLDFRNELERNLGSWRL